MSMTATFPPWWVTIALLVTALLVAEYREHQWGRAIAKVLASTCFVLAAWLHIPLENASSLAVFVGLCCSAVGDVALIPSKRWFLMGIVAFLLAHVAYMVAFLFLDLQLSWMLAASLVLVPIGFGVQKWLMPDVQKNLKLAVRAYILVISSMVVCSIAVYGGQTQKALIPLAATLFFISDLAVAKQRFKAPSFRNKLWGLPTYYAAQMLFVLVGANPGVL